MHMVCQTYHIYHITYHIWFYMHIIYDHIWFYIHIIYDFIYISYMILYISYISYISHNISYMILYIIYIIASFHFCYLQRQLRMKRGYIISQYTFSISYFIRYFICYHCEITHEILVVWLMKQLTCEYVVCNLFVNTLSVTCLWIRYLELTCE